MKVAKGISVAMLIIAFSFMTFARTSSSSNEDSTVKLAVEKFVSASQDKNSKDLESILSDNFSFFNYNSITKEGAQMTKGDYINNIKKGAIGGWVSKLNINSIDVSDNTAMAKIELVDTRVKQSGYLTLIKVNGEWEILNGVYTLETVNK
jgi:Putative lumazine-binding